MKRGIAALGQRMTYHLLCLPVFEYMTLPALQELLAEMEAIEDKDFNVYDAIARIKKRIDELQAGRAK